MLSTIDSMSPSMTAPSSGIKIHTKKWYQQMALILLCEEVIEPTASAVMCVKNDRICDIIFQLYPSAWCQIIHLTKIRTESENSRLVPFSATKKLPWGKWLPRPQKWMEKNSDKSHGSTGMFPHQFGRFLPLVGHLPSENSILSNFSSPRGVAILGCEYQSQAGSATQSTSARERLLITAQSAFKRKGDWLIRLLVTAHGLMH